MVGVMGGERGARAPGCSPGRGSGDSRLLVWRPQRDDALSGGRRFQRREPSLISICWAWKVLAGGRKQLSPRR